jgi:hypothetical protein
MTNRFEISSSGDCGPLVSDSLLAPILLHWAVNGFGTIFVKFA